MIDDGRIRSVRYMTLADVLLGISDLPSRLRVQDFVIGELSDMVTANMHSLILARDVRHTLSDMGKKQFSKETRREIKMVKSLLCELENAGIHMASQPQVSRLGECDLLLAHGYVLFRVERELRG